MRITPVFIFMLNSCATQRKESRVIQISEDEKVVCPIIRDIELPKDDAVEEAKYQAEKNGATHIQIFLRNKETLLFHLHNCSGIQEVTINTDNESIQKNPLSSFPKKDFKEFFETFEPPNEFSNSNVWKFPVSNKDPKYEGEIHEKCFFRDSDDKVNYCLAAIYCADQVCSKEIRKSLNTKSNVKFKKTEVEKILWKERFSSQLTNVAIKQIRILPFDLNQMIGQIFTQGLISMGQVIGAGLGGLLKAVTVDPVGARLMGGSNEFNEYQNQMDHSKNQAREPDLNKKDITQNRKENVKKRMVYVRESLLYNNDSIYIYSMVSENRNTLSELGLSKTYEGGLRKISNSIKSMEKL